MHYLQMLPVLAVCISAILLSRRLLHYFQLESYQFRGFFKTLDRQLEHAVLPGLCLSACSLIILLLSYLIRVSPENNAYAVLQAMIAALTVLSAVVIRRKMLRGVKEKKPFRRTARIKRLIIWLTLILFAAAFLMWLVFRPDLDNSGLSNVIYSLIPLFLPVWVVLAALLAVPLERLIYEMYFRDARKKLLNNERLIRIGITGSYGKTSTKFILREMLSQKYNVLATPDSYNTPMGITGIIRSRLTPAHQVFIAEMGARHPQDIRELCRLVHPTVGMLTSVGPQHLDTFGSLERIRQTKYDLIRALPDNGIAVFAHDGGIVTELYEQTQKPKLLAGRENADAWATDVSVNASGSRFKLHLADRLPFECTTPMLGRHNIDNIVAAAALASHLGVSDRQLQAAIAQLKPVQHRLQIVSTAGGVTVIDDAFNTNPVSSKAALDVLKMFEGRRIIVTPGMVELGAEEPLYNREFGEYMADCVDLALLIGKRHTAPIREGLLSKGFSEENIMTFASLEDAVASLRSLNRKGDTVMYENDLPDSYSEEN